MGFKVTSVTLALGLLVVLFCASCSMASNVASSPFHVQRLAADGKGCLACSAIVAIARNVLTDHEKDISQLTAQLCNLLPEPAKTTCVDIVQLFGDDILKMLFDNVSPSLICSKLNLCNQCHLGGTQNGKLQFASEDDRQFAAQFTAMLISLANTVGTGESKDEQNAQPDIDGDGYGFLTGHRGTDWRGRDCNDFSKDVRPGKLAKYDSWIDHDCNGIPDRKDAELCADYPARQIVMFGDSASSGFSLLSQWTHLQDMGPVLRAALDEFDFPQTSYSTGHNSDNTESIYSHLLDRNRCYHRQYANVGKNGAEMMHFVHQVELLQLDPASDKPVLGFLDYVGNDICEDSLDKMTTPEDFRQQLLAGLAKLDSVAPAGSKLFIMGVVDGRILYDVSANRTHPLGGTVEDFYEFLTCVGSNPCGTWLTKDKATRDAASARAAELSDVAEEIVANSKGVYKNLELAYWDFPLELAFQILEREHKDPSILIGDVDFFHPSVPVAHQYLGEVIWEHLSQNFADWVGPVNPHNAEIQRLYGNQGGY